MKRLFLLFGFIFTVAVGHSQLSVGDIAFVQYGADGIDNFAFVALVNIPGGEIISFTDNEENDIAGSEGTIIWTSPAITGVSCGTVVTITASPSATIGSVSEINPLVISIGGDGIIAYQGPPASPTFITALGNDGPIGGDYSDANEGNLPSGLTLGVNAQSIVEIDNAIYNGSLLNDTKANLLASIYNFANWIGNDQVNLTFSDLFTVTSCVSGPEITTSSSSIVGLDYIEGDVDGSDSQSFEVSASGFSPSSTITLTSPANFLISTTNGSGYVTSVDLTTNGSGDLIPTDIFVILQPGLAVGNYYLFDLIISGPGALGVLVTLTGDVFSSNATFFEQGDLAIVAVNTDYLSSGIDDEICFVTFEDLTESTWIDMTDNGYEKVTTGLWGGTEGVVRFQRTGNGTILAGTPICFRGAGNGDNIGSYDVYVCGVLDNTNWSITNLNYHMGELDYRINLSTNGDQMWIIQGGTWTGGGLAEDGFYSGNVLFGWTGTGWASNSGYNSVFGSTLYPRSKCFTIDVNGIANQSKVKYTGPMTTAAKLDWISRINDNTNWTGYANNLAYGAGGPDYGGLPCVTFPVNPSSISDGTWTGSIDDQWFECANWSNLKVPTAASDVQIPNVANDAIIDATHADASIYGSIAEVNELTITGNVEVFDATDQLLVNGDLNIVDNASLINQDGGNIEILGTLALLGSNSVLDMNSPSTTSTITLHGDWINGANGTATNGFIENNSLVDFVGLGTQTIDGSSIVTGTETFYNVTINKPAGTKVELAGSDMNITNALQFGTGIIDAESDGMKVVVTNNSPAAITGYEAPNSTGVYPVNDGYVEGRLERAVLTGIYDFPVGDRPSGLGYNPVNMNIASGTGNVSAIFDPASPGVMNLYDNTQLCGATQRILNYEEFANDGYWNLTGPLGMVYTVTMHPNTGLNAPFAPPPDNEYRLMRSPSGTAGAVTNVWPSASAYEGDICTFTGYAAASGTYSGFSDFAIQADILNPLLPIELLSFVAKNQNRDIEISWVTATEINNDRFELYHSKDGIEWDKINVQNGAGTTAIERSYSYLHKTPSWGIHYYQLKQVDFDGVFSMSEIEVAEIGSNDDITVYPVPTSNILFIDVATTLDERSIHIHNEQGQLIGDWNLDNNRLNIERLNGGVYFITFIGQENTVVKKFIKISSE